MTKKEDSSISAYSITNYSRTRRPFILRQENKIPMISNLLKASNDSDLNNSENEIKEADNDYDEADILENSIEEQHLYTPMNDTYRFFSKNRFGKTYKNSIPIKKINIPKSKSPNVKSLGSYRSRNDFSLSLDNLKKNSIKNNEIFLTNNDFLHCRNCMLIVALSRYGKYYFNK